MDILKELETAPVCCFILDEALRVLECNKWSADIFAISNPENIKNTPIIKISPQKQRDGQLSSIFLARMAGKARSEGAAYFEWTATTKQGIDFQTEATLVPYNYEGSNLSLLYLRADRHLRVIFDSIPMACHFRDKNYNIIDANQACVDIFGLKSKQEYKDRFFSLSPELQPCGTPSVELAKIYIDRAFKLGQTQIEWTHIDADGNLFLVDVNLVKVRWHNEDHILCIMRDLRDIAKARKAEIAMKERVQLMLDSSPLVCAIHDQNLNLIEASNEVINLFELSDKQEYFDRFMELSPTYQPDGRLSAEKMFEVVHLAFEMGRLTTPWLHQTLSGSPIPVELTLVRVQHGEQNLMISYLRDLREVNNTMEMVKHLETLAYIDPLTGAFNRRYFMEQAEQKLHYSHESGDSFSLIMADIDFFKKVNDTYGHDVGDEVLKILVQRLKHVLRDVVVARYGGEEFIILLPGVNAEHAEEIAWRLHKNITATEFKIAGSEQISIPITSSFGIASLENSGQNLASILKNADIALYEAKAAGRNTVVAHSEKDKH